MQISFTPEFASRVRQDLVSRGDLSKRNQASGADHRVDHVAQRWVQTAAEVLGHNPHGGGNSYDLEICMDQDMLVTSVGWANSYYLGQEYTDEWGVSWKAAPYTTRFGSGWYSEIVGHPLSDDASINSYQSPDPERPELYDAAAWLVRTYGRDYWIVGATVTTIFETAWALRGLDQMLVDLVASPDLAERILDIPYRYHATAAKKLTELGVDMIWTGDDMGTQRTMLISPDLWRRFFKPRMAQLFADLKAVNSAIKIAYHSDGNIEPIIDDLVEIGLDVLNPVQPASMNPTTLKRRYGNHLAFWGTIDEQHTLPFGTPEQVRSETYQRISEVGTGGGLIISPTHHVQLDTPLPNLYAMIDTILTTRCT
jgi:uroporphyrinogen decarboxylase